MRRCAVAALLFAVPALALAVAGCRLPGGTGRATVPPDPVLRDLGARLAAIVERGALPAAPTGAVADAWVSYRHPEFGVAADYKRYIEGVRAYNRTLDAAQQTVQFPILRELQDNPVAAPWRTEQWLRPLFAESAGPAAAFAQADHLLAAFPPPSARPPAAAADPRRPAPANDELDRLVAAFVGAAARVDEQALGAVPPAQRELLRFVLPWLCRSAGSFVNRSKGAPAYDMYWHFAPADPFAPGASRTESGAMEVPAALGSMTGLYHYLRALAGEPLQTTGIRQDHAHAYNHPAFAAAVDYGAMGAALAVLRTALAPTRLDALAAELARRPTVAHTVPGATGTLLAVIDTAYGRAIVGGPGPNRYTDVEAALILDAGGDDTYEWTRAPARVARYPVDLLVDLAGDDLYQVDGVGGPGAGILGIGILLDRAGNDRYCQGLAPTFAARRATRASLVRPDPEGVNTPLVPYIELYGNPAAPAEPGVPLDAGFAFGAGFLGVGLLVDEAGDDLYLGQKWCFGAAMCRGVGVLHDAAGDDVYVTGVAALGAGVNLAFGLLDDRAGHDHYQCLGHHESGYSEGQEWDNGYSGAGIGFGSSWRAEARGGGPERRWQATFGGGLGLLHDGAGDDRYIGSSFGVAAGYAGGAGLVVDDAGDDTWFVKRGPGGANRSGWSGNHALGNGCHRGIGYLLDRAGNDRYSAGNLGGGNAWDIGSGYLLDLGGDDLLTDLHGQKEQGSTGWAGAKAFAVSFHQGGTDTYERRTCGDAGAIGDGYPGEGGNFGFFFDLGPETDRYAGGQPNDACQPGPVTTTPEADGQKYPQGIGFFLDDGADAPPNPRSQP